jgi:hypothetical protein
MLPPEEELLSDQDLREASVEQEQPQPGESLERPAID